MKYLILFIVVLFFAGCNSEEKIRNNYLKKIETGLPGNLNFINPGDGTVFPPEFPAPSFMWNDNSKESKKWLINIKINQTENFYSEIVNTTNWNPELNLWETLKKKSIVNPAIITVIGIDSKKSNTIFSGAQICIQTSTDSVGAPIFYRAVPLPFSFATSHLDSIKYMLGNVSSSENPKILLENLPVCGNCHSFSPDGKSFAMDVDAFGDKGSYLIAQVDKEVEMSHEKFITWSDFQEKSTMALLSQISPNGKFVISTLDDNEIFEARDKLEYSQLFFPIKGILTVYDIETKTFKALSGADDTTFVQSNSTWTPDNKTIYFARNKAVQRNKSGMTYGTGIYDINKFQAVRDSFLSRKKEFKFDIMKIPFNEGKGGIPERIEGASQNNKSNYFPKVSPDGKWMVFCQADNYMLLQPDSKLYIVPTDGSAAPRLMNCNTNNMNSWHSWSPNNRWLVFSSKSLGAYTQLFITHIDENGNDSPPVWLEYFNVDKRAANIPEFVNTNFDQFNKIIDKFSDVADYNVRGTSKAQFGDFRGALDEFNRAIQINNNDDQAYANRGKAKDELGDLEGAYADLSKAIQLKPEEHDYYIHRGNTLVKMNNLQGAIEDCSNAIELQPEDAALYAHRAGIYQLVSKNNEAIEDLSMAIKQKPDYALYYIHRANVYNQLKQKAAVEKDIEKAISLEPSNVKYIMLNGIYAKNYGDDAKAVSIFKKAISINPGYFEAYSELALLLYEQKKYEEAMANFDEAIKNYDKSSKKELAFIYNNRGTVFGEMGKFDLAVNDFSQAIQLYSNFADAYSNRAYARLNLNQITEAEQDCYVALTIEPDMKKALMIKDMILKKSN